MARTDKLTNFLTDVATAIKTKKGDNTSIPVSNFDTEIANLSSGGSADFEITDASYLFYKKARLNVIDELLAKCKNVTNAAYMFQNCSNLTTLDLSNFDTSKITNMVQMFQGCSSLTTLDLSNFDTSNVSNMNLMFYNCSSLTMLDIRNFSFSNVAIYNNMLGSIPANCLIIVKDETAKKWITSKFSTLTNVKTVAEYEG